MSIIAITQIIESSTNVTLSAVAGKIQRVVNIHATNSITVTYGGSTFTLPAGKFADFWYDGAVWRVDSSDLISASAPTFTGLVDISASSAGRIKFPATANLSTNANTIDDYEEGLWTPVIEGTSSSGVGTYSSQAGVYTKIGNIVHVAFLIIWTAHTGTGNITVTGLPFTLASMNFPAAMYTSNLTFTGSWVTAQVVADTTTMNLISPTSGAPYATVAMDTAATIVGQVSYRTSL